MFTQLLSNLAAGGVTGYITNSLAIKMLFKKYPVVGGGVLVDNFEEFVENISQLVERDLINHATLEQEFSNERFKTELQTAITYLLRHSLYKKFSNDTLSEIPGLQESVDALLDFFEPHETELVNKLLIEVAAHIDIDEFLSASQQEKLGSTLFSHIYESIVTELPQVLALMNESDLAISDLLSEKILAAFNKELEPLLDLLLQTIDRDALKRLLETLQDRLELDTLLQNISTQLFSKSIEEILGKERTQRLSQHLIEQFIRLMQNEEGLEQLSQFAAAALEGLKKIDEPLTAFMHESTKDEIIALIETYLPLLLRLIIKWIEGNSKDLKSLIERLINASLKSGGLRGKMKYSLKALFIGKVTERFRMIERLTGILGDESSREEHIAKGVTLVLDAISKKSIGTVIDELTSRHWLTPGLIAKLMQLNLRRAAPFIERLMLGELFSRPLSSLFNAQWQAKLIDQVTLVLTPSALTAWLKSDEGRKNTLLLGKSLTAKGLELPVSILVGKDASALLLQELSQHKSQLESTFKERLGAVVQTLSLSEFLDEQTFTLLRPKLQDILQENKASLQKKLHTRSLHELFDVISRREASAARLSNIAIMGINDNLHFLLEKNVSQTVQNELLALGPQILQERVEEFMGAELGPITWLGAGLGAGVGGVLYGVQQYFGALNGPYLYGAIPAVYGATGILTNYLALKMLFKPYETKRLLGIPIPFTPGIVGKRKPFFAKNMSEFVDQTLLTRSAIHEKIITLKPQLIESLKTYIIADNYKMAEQFLHHHADYFADQIFTLAFESIPSYIDSKAMAEKTVQFINSADLSSLAIRENRGTLTKKLQQRAMHEIAKETGKWYRQYHDQSLNIAIPSQTVTLMDRLIDLGADRGIDYAATLMDSQEPVYKLLIALVEPLLQQWDDKRISDLLNDDMLRIFRTRVSLYIVERLQSTNIQHQIIEFVQTILIDETVESDRKIGSMFNGALTEAIEENLRLLFDHGFDEIITHLKSEKELITAEVVSAIKEHNSFAANSLFRLSGVFGDIERFIAILIDEEMLTFFNERQEEIEATTHRFFDELKEKELKNFGIKSGLFNLYAFEPIVQQILQHPSVATSIGSISDRMIEDTFAATLDEKLQVLDFESTHAMLYSFDDEVGLARTHLQRHLIREHHEVAGEIAAFVQKTRTDFFAKQTLSDCFPELTETDLTEQIDYSMQQLFASSGYALLEQRLVTGLLSEFKSHGIGFLIDEKQLASDLDIVITSLLGNETLQGNIAEITRPLLVSVLQSLNDLTDDRLKQFLLDNGFEAAYDTLLENTDGLLGSIDFKAVIEREINAMHPKELEDMLNSFAKVYFNRLIMYGAYGAVFGIPVAFSY